MIIFIVGLAVESSEAVEETVMTEAMLSDREAGTTGRTAGLAGLGASESLPESVAAACSAGSVDSPVSAGSVGGEGGEGRRATKSTECGRACGWLAGTTNESPKLILEALVMGLISAGERVRRKSRYAAGGVIGVLRPSSFLMKVGVPTMGLRSSEG